MARLVPIALLLAFSADPAWSQAAEVAEPAPELARRYTLPDSRTSHDLDGRQDRIIVGIEIGPNAHFGFDFFGLRRERTGLAPMTVYELNTRQSRKAAVGFRLRF